VTLPPGLDENKVEAKYHNGVLTVRLPKTAAAKGRRVPVKSA
jgi:HSP20 family protein